MCRHYIFFSKTVHGIGSSTIYSWNRPRLWDICQWALFCWSVPVEVIYVRTEKWHKSVWLRSIQRHKSDTDAHKHIGRFSVGKQGWVESDWQVSCAHPDDHKSIQSLEWDICRGVSRDEELVRSGSPFGLSFFWRIRYGSRILILRQVFQSDVWIHNPTGNKVIWEDKYREKWVERNNLI